VSSRHLPFSGKKGTVALGNTPRRETIFSVETSKSYAFGVRFKTLEDTPVDLTGCDVRLVISEPGYFGGAEVLSLLATSADFRTGFVQFNLQAQDLALEPASYPFDITLIPTSDYSTPILKGLFEVGPNTDLDTSNVYSGVNVGSDITVTLEHGDIIDITIERVDGVYLILGGMIEDFSEEMAAAVAAAEAAAAEAEDAAELSKSYHDDMQVWLDNAGFPFWKGTYAEYQAITKKEEVLYLITDEVVQ
jgi:hypothetical protein